MSAYSDQTLSAIGSLGWVPKTSHARLIGVGQLQIPQTRERERERERERTQYLIVNGVAINYLVDCVID